jgi:hypothetical protein
MVRNRNVLLSADPVTGEDTQARTDFPIRVGSGAVVAAARPGRTRRFPAHPHQDPWSHSMTKLAVSGQPLMAASGQIPMAANTVVLRS